MAFKSAKRMLSPWRDTTGGITVPLNSTMQRTMESDNGKDNRAYCRAYVLAIRGRTLRLVFRLINGVIK